MVQIGVQADQMICPADQLYRHRYSVETSADQSLAATPTSLYELRQPPGPTFNL